MINRQIHFKFYYYNYSYSKFPKTFRLDFFDSKFDLQRAKLSLSNYKSPSILELSFSYWKNLETLWNQSFILNYGTFEEF